jgi:hypothetical protein
MGQLTWYIARAGGIVAWALLGASVIWGLWLSGRVRPLGARPAWILDLHRFLGGLATIFVGVHVGSILLDTYTSFGLADVLVPFASSWHPFAVAWGVVAMYVLLAVELTSLARHRLPQRLWRTLHVASLPLFVLATIHYVAAGTDAANPMSLAAIGLMSAAIVMLFTRRMHEVRARGGGLIPASPSPTTDAVPSPVVPPPGAPGVVVARTATTEERIARLAARRAGTSVGA